MRVLRSEQELELLISIKEKATKFNELFIQSKELIIAYTDVALAEINKEIEEDKTFYNQKKNEVERWYKKSILDVRNQVFNFQENSGYMLMPFTDNRWNNYKTPKHESSLIMLGNKVISNGRDELEIPYMISFKDSNNLLFLETGEELVKSVLLRYFLIIPAGKLDVIIIDDSKKLGQNMRNFLKFKEYNSKLINEKIYTEEREIDDQISDTWNKVQDRAQNYLGVKQCKDIHEFNNRFKENQLNYKIVVLLSFPKQISKKSLDNLNKILKHGPKCGVYTFISADNKHDLPSDFVVGNINDIINPIEKVSETQFKLNKTVFIAERLDDVRTNYIIDEIGKNYLELENERISEQQQKDIERERRESKNLLFDELESEYTQEEIWWRATSNTKLEALIGKTINGKLQNITFEDSFVHALIAGTTGSGKSALLHTIILSLALKYSPEELELYLLDFKEGLEFNAYKNLPHAKLVSIKSDRELGTELSHPVN